MNVKIKHVSVDKKKEWRLKMTKKLFYIIIGVYFSTIGGDVAGLPLPNFEVPDFPGIDEKHEKPDAFDVNGMMILKEEGKTDAEIQEIFPDLAIPPDLAELNKKANAEDEAAKAAGGK
jgi:hypothetical protein